MTTPVSTTTSSTVVAPKRGGLHPSFGVYLGGAPLDNGYDLDNDGASTYRFSSQRRHPKTISHLESDLKTAKDSTTTIKFNGNLEVEKSNLSEIGKDRFQDLLEEKVEEFGMENFFSIADSTPKVVSLFKNEHRFTVQNTLDEYLARTVSTNKANDAYDQYERDDVQLSRLVVESLLTVSFREKIQVRFGHMKNYKRLPGQVFYMMALDTCNASMATDVDGACVSFNALCLDSYPGENIADFITDAQRFIKIMQSGYALPRTTGTDIIRKILSTQSEEFNRKMYSLLDKTKTMEHKYKLANPKSLESDPEYPLYGPIALLGIIYQEHALLVKDKTWPALATKLPEGNQAPADSTGNTSDHNGGRGRGGNGGRGNRGGRGGHGGRNGGRGNKNLSCYNCGGSHMARHCPKSSNKDGTSKNKTTTSTKDTDSGTHQRKSRPLAAWKYVRPYDLTQVITDEKGREWKHCTKCKCRATGKTGIYQLSHLDSEHVENYQRPSGNHSQVSDPDPVPAGPPTVTGPEPSQNDFDDDELEFQGVWCTPVEDSAHTVRSVPTTVTLVRDIPVTTVSEYDSDDDDDVPPLMPRPTFDEEDSDNESMPPAAVTNLFINLFDDDADADTDLIDDDVDADTDLIVETVSEYDSDDEECLPPEVSSYSFLPPSHPNYSWCQECTPSDHLSFVERETTTVPSFDDVYYDTIDEVPDEFHDCFSCSEELLEFPIHEPVDTYYDCSDEELCSTEYKGYQFYDTNSGLESSDLSFFSNLPTGASFFLLFLFWTCAMSWDIIQYLLNGPTYQPSRRIRRAKRKPTLLTYPARWLVFTGALMALASTYLGHPPTFPIPSVTSSVNTISNLSKETYGRVSIIDDMVALNYGSLNHFNQLKAQQLVDTIKLINKKVSTSPDQSSTSLTTAEEDEYFDGYTDIPVVEEQYFDSFATTDELHELDRINDFDPFAFASLRTVYHRDCVYETAADALDLLQSDPVANGPTVRALAGLTDLSHLASDPDVFMALGPNRKAVIFDTGASLAITFDESDFDGPITPSPADLRLGGMAGGMKIAGCGPVTWTFANGDGTELQIRTQCYHVPQAKTRLLSPQRLFNKTQGVAGHYLGDEESFRLHFNDVPPLTVEYDSRSHLPIGYATRCQSNSPQVNLSLVSDDNQNLTAGQKLLLEWHTRFGHLNFQSLQRILRAVPFTANRFGPASKCDTQGLRCATCEYAKGHRRPKKSTVSHATQERDGALKAGDLRAGASVSVDRFESRLPGRTFDSYGKPTSSTYKGGCIFVDHSSGYIHVEHQVGFTAVETIRAKQNFEKLALDHGVIVESYLTDSGAFKANKFVTHIRDHGQKIKYCGTNAHHQNGIVERSVRTISNMARAMILHASSHWKNGIDSSLWPMAVTYACHVYNSSPNNKGIAPADLFTGSTVPRHRLRDLHVWGCPVYVLDPQLQSGKKLPRWQPRSRRGIFLGLSTIHSSEVPFVLNLQTGSITTQYHVVFDDLFSTVESIARENEPPDHWAELCLENSVYIPTEPSDTPLHLQDDWLTPPERALKQRELQRSAKIRATFEPSTTTKSASTKATRSSDGATRSSEGATRSSEGATRSTNGATRSTSPTVQEPTPQIASLTTPALPAPTPAATSDTSLRRSTRSTKGTFKSTKYHEVYLTQIDRFSNPEAHEAQLAYHAELFTCYDSGQNNITDPRAYAAKYRKLDDPDNPTIHQALQGPHSDDYIAAMKLEIATLLKQKTWSMVPRTNEMNVLKGTWAFKLKRLPDGTAYRFKARFCARGDLQEEGVDFFETYAPVVQWSTIRLLLTRSHRRMGNTSGGLH